MGKLPVDLLLADRVGDAHERYVAAEGCRTGRGVGGPCDGTGTSVGAPLFDMDGESRSPTTPDIGADEVR